MIIKSYLHSSYCVTVVSEEHLDIKLPNTFMYIFSNNFEKLLNYTLNASEMGCSDYIVQMNEPEIFMKAFEKVVHLGNVRRSDRKIIMLLPQSKSNNSAEKLINVLSMKETGFVANVLLILPLDSSCECDMYDLITHKFVGFSSDEQNKSLYLDTWNSCTKKYLKDSNLFPHDMSNLYGKTLKVAGFTYKPYILLDLDPTVVPQGRDGMDVRIVDQFCRYI